MLFANFGIHVRSRTKKGMHRNSLGFLAENFYAVKCVIFTSQITMHLNAFVGLHGSFQTAREPFSCIEDGAAHVLKPLIPNNTQHDYNLQDRSHNFELIDKNAHLKRPSFYCSATIQRLVLIVKLRSYNFNWLIAHCILFCQLYSYCEVAFWQLLLNEDCDCEEENRGIEECEDKEGTEGRLLLITQLSCLQPHIKTCIKQSQI